MIDINAQGLVEQSCDYYLNPWTDLLLAMVQAEGGHDAFIKALQCSMPDVKTFDVALARACKTVRGLAASMPSIMIYHKAGVDPWTKEASPRCFSITPRFLRELADKWAPQGAANDPHALNANWYGNVERVYLQLSGVDPVEWAKSKGGDIKASLGGTPGVGASVTPPLLESDGRPLGWELTAQAKRVHDDEQAVGGNKP